MRRVRKRKKQSSSTASYLERPTETRKMQVSATPMAILLQIFFRHNLDTDQELASKFLTSMGSALDISFIVQRQTFKGRSFSSVRETDMLQEKKKGQKEESEPCFSGPFLRVALGCRSQMLIVSCLLPQHLEERQGENIPGCQLVTGYLY